MIQGMVSRSSDNDERKQWERKYELLVDDLNTKKLIARY
jgi:hypothetical protein